jgi:hypothetical protein
VTSIWYRVMRVDGPRHREWNGKEAADPWEQDGSSRHCEMSSGEEGRARNWGRKHCGKQVETTDTSINDAVTTF